MRVSRYFLAVLILTVAAGNAFGRICPKCGRDHLPDNPKPTVQEPPNAEPEQ